MAGCYDCGLEYGGPHWIEAIIPDSVWNAIRPHGCAEGCGLLCVSCIANRLVSFGIKDVPVWFTGTEPLIAFSGNPQENSSLLRSFKFRRLPILPVPIKHNTIHV